MQEHIWTPLEMDSTTFRVNDRPDVAARLPQMVARSPSGTLIESDTFTGPLKSVKRDIGGGGLHSSAEDYLKLLIALLRNDGTLLSKSSVADLLKPQVNDIEYLKDEHNARMFGDMWPSGGKVRCNHGLGGLVIVEDLSSGRKKGSMMWFGSSMIVWVRHHPLHAMLKRHLLIDFSSGSTRKVKCAASLARRSCLELPM